MGSHLNKSAVRDLDELWKPIVSHKRHCRRVSSAKKTTTCPFQAPKVQPTASGLRNTRSRGSVRGKGMESAIDALTQGGATSSGPFTAIAAEVPAHAPIVSERYAAEQFNE